MLQINKCYQFALTLLCFMGKWTKK
jgi:hypothetical protein